MVHSTPFSPRRPAALVFDLDGTLIDSRRDITTAINRMRGSYGLPPLPLERVVTMVGEGARVLIERAVGGELPVAELDPALRRYLAAYDDVLLDTTRAYPGVPEMLAALAVAYPVALLSNKGETPSRRILEGLGLASLFRLILGGDSLPTRKPDPAGLRLAAERLGVPAADLMLIGDTRIDALTAHAAGALFGLVEWGFPRPATLDGLAADLRAKEPAEVSAALLRT
ncbi:MAG TPA: HAD-IA family hydrolase [Thermoanaerobaculia bacterium]|jgi:phosphoglycolate phosphatase|nr:HAD-IA family hydrolase [Thermoanaerobaculia bacterium]